MKIPAAILIVNIMSIASVIILVNKILLYAFTNQSVLPEDLLSDI